MRDRCALDRARLLLACLAVGCLTVPAATAAETPAIKAKRAQAKQVLAEINAIDERLSVVTEKYDGARVHLAAIQARLTKEKTSLARAQVQNERAQNRVATLLVQLYESGRPTALEAILGATSIEDMLNATDAESAIAKSDKAVAEQADAARIRLAHAVASLRSDRAGAARTLHQLQASRVSVEAGLADRQRLLRTVQGQLTHLEAVERARQARLAAEARARLKAAEAAAARARAAAAAAARQRMLANQQAAATTSTVATTTTAATATTPGPATTTSTPVVPVTTTAPVPTTLPAGHPEAAQVALGYIGVPYVWGGSTPSGFDCSGLVSYVYAQLGISLPHYAAAQYTYGVPVPRDQLQPGDLVFFDDLDHVGIYIGNNEFVAAPHTGTFVRIDSLAEGWYDKRYVGARRI